MFVLKCRYEFLEKEYLALEKKNKLLQEDLKQRNQQISDLQQELEDKMEVVYSEEVERCDFEVDFNALNVFSIERVRKNNVIYTVMGYYKPDGKIGEWNFTCSYTQHQRLAEQFRQHIKK